RAEALPEAFGVDLGFGIFLASLYPPRHWISSIPLGAACLGLTQSWERRTRLKSSCKVMSKQWCSPALNDPVVAFKLKHSQSLQLLLAEAAQQVDDLAAPFILAFDPGFQACGQSGCRKANWLGGVRCRVMHAISCNPVRSRPAWPWLRAGNPV